MDDFDDQHNKKTSWCVDDSAAERIFYPEGEHTTKCGGRPSIVLRLGIEEGLTSALPLFRFGADDDLRFCHCPTIGGIRSDMDLVAYCFERHNCWPMEARALP